MIMYGEMRRFLFLVPSTEKENSDGLWQQEIVIATFLNSSYFLCPCDWFHPLSFIIFTVLIHWLLHFLTIYTDECTWCVCTRACPLVYVTQFTCGNI